MNGVVFVGKCRTCRARAVVGKVADYCQHCGGSVEWKETGACVRGCLRRDRHLDDCDVDACTACLPRFATHGQACDKDFTRLWDWLIDIPDLYALLAEDDEWLLPVAGGTVDGKKKGKRSESPAPGRVSVMDARDTRVVDGTEDRRGVLGVVHAWAELVRQERGQPVGEDGGQGAKAGLGAHAASCPPSPTVVSETELLRDHLDWVAAQPWLLDAWDELRHLHGELTEATRMTPRPEPGDADCFDCGDRLVKRFEDARPCGHGERPAYPEIPPYPQRRPGKAHEDHQAEIQLWKAVRNELAALHAAELAEWEMDHSRCVQGGRVAEYQCRGCGTKYSDERYRLSVKEKWEKRRDEVA